MAEWLAVAGFILGVGALLAGIVIVANLMYPDLE